MSSQLELLKAAMLALNINELAQLGEEVARVGNHVDSSRKVWIFKVENQVAARAPFKPKSDILPFWMKAITTYNPRKLGSGFAFEGDFINKTALSKLADGQLVVIASKDSEHAYYALCSTDKSSLSVHISTTFDGLTTLMAGENANASLSERERKRAAMRPVMEYMESAFPEMAVGS
jgi:hypothetical protein